VAGEAKESLEKQVRPDEGPVEIHSEGNLRVRVAVRFLVRWGRGTHEGSPRLCDRPVGSRDARSSGYPALKPVRWANRFRSLSPGPSGNCSEIRRLRPRGPAANVGRDAVFLTVVEARAFGQRRPVPAKTIIFPPSPTGALRNLTGGWNRLPEIRPS